ncbi:hypothetical protein M5E82_10425 [Parabacteroides distasonis]|nr:hypothetical protein M5E82_10425 [Parabacteroides distasonis]
MKSVADALGNAADAVGNIADGVGNTADTVGNQFSLNTKDGNIRMESKEDTDKIQFRKDNFKEYL